MRPEQQALYDRIHPDLQSAARVMWRINPTFTIKRLRAMNWLQRNVPNPLRILKKHQQLQVKRPDGTSLKLLVFSPKGAKGPLPCMLWFHGGGYAIGSAASAERMAKLLNTVLPCVVIAPEYRLSLQAPYPAALEDAHLAFTWVQAHAEALGVDESRLMVGGESAGGGLSAALCLYVRDQGNKGRQGNQVAQEIFLQMPLYPMLDDRMNTPSATDNWAPVWNSESNRNAWELFLGALKPGQGDVPPYAAPARATDLSGLPPLISFVGDLEPFYDECITYFEGLKAAGVPVNYRVFEGAYHAFEQMAPHSPIAKAALDFVCAAFKEALEGETFTSSACPQ